MKKKIFFIILCILFIPFIVHAEEDNIEEEKLEKEYVFEKVNINITIDEEKKQLIVNEKILTGDIDEELVVGRSYDSSLPNAEKLLEDFPCKLKSNTEYNYSYVIDSSNDKANFKFLKYYKANLDDDGKLIGLESYSFKYNLVEIRLFNAGEDDIKNVSIYDGDSFTHIKYDKYIFFVHEYGKEIIDNPALFEKDFREEPKKALSSFALVTYILIGLLIVSTIYLFIITRFKRINVSELDIDTDIKRWYEEKRSAHDMESFGVAMIIIMLSIMLPVFLPQFINSLLGLDSYTPIFAEVEHYINAQNVILFFIMVLISLALISRCYYHTRILFLSRKIPDAKIMRLTSYNMSKKINQESADTYTITAHINGTEYKKKGKYNNYLKYDDPHIVLYGNNKFDIFFKQ